MIFLCVDTIVKIPCLPMFESILSSMMFEKTRNELSCQIPTELNMEQRQSEHRKISMYNYLCISRLTQCDFVHIYIHLYILYSILYQEEQGKLGHLDNLIK